MTEPYLILHKVRGEPAFDIAIQFEFDDGEAGWIIPTSGHRAYPYKHWLMDELVDASDYPHVRPFDYYAALAAPEGWPDHYQPQRSPSIVLTTASALLAKLGLGPAPIKRRRIE